MDDSQIVEKGKATTTAVIFAITIMVHENREGFSDTVCTGMSEWPVPSHLE